MPACLGASGSVRAPTQYHSAKCADVVHVFCPLRIQPEVPSRSTARRLQLHRCRIRARVGLAVSDGELDLRVEDLGQELGFEIVAADPDERLADDADALADLRTAAARERLVQQELVDALTVLAAVLLGPGEAEPAPVGELLHERAPGWRVDDLGHVLPRDVEHLGIVVGVEELLHLFGERALLRGEIEVHCALRTLTI